MSAEFAPPAPNNEIPRVGHGVVIIAGLAVLISAVLSASYAIRRFCVRFPDPIGEGNNPAAAPEDYCPTLGGLEQVTIDSYPKMKYNENREPPAASVADDCCPICLSDYVARDEVRRLPRCGHVFHVACIDAWLRLHATCPICRNSPPAPRPAPPGEARPVPNRSRYSA